MPIGDKRSLSFRFARQAATADEMHAFLGQLAQLDPEFHAIMGGEIHRQIHPYPQSAALTELPPLARFDERFLTLMQWFASFDRETARDLHERSLELCRVMSSSWVRYHRVGLSIKNTGLIFDDLRKKELTFHSIIPVFDDSLMWQSMNLETASHDLTQGRTGELQAYAATQAHAPAQPHPAMLLVPEADDSAQAEPLWADYTQVQDEDVVKCYRLPNARISSRPTGICFQADAATATRTTEQAATPGAGNPKAEVGDYRYIHAMSDRHQYFRLAGQVALGTIKEQWNRGWLLPRFSINNHYHSLIERLPSLFAYRLLNMDCPILSSYELNETEKVLVEAMGIDPTLITVDLQSAVVVKDAYLANCESVFRHYARFMGAVDTGAHADAGRRLYISRHQSSDRPMVNERAVHELVSTFGFQIVSLEQYTLLEQIELMRRAEIIIGPHGAGLSNMMFASPGAQIVELIPRRYMAPMFKRLAAQCAHRYAVLIGEMEALCTIEDDFKWQVDLVRLTRLLETFNAQGDTRRSLSEHKRLR